jgi:Holliday junction resolvase RusA-like endonuclease
MCGMIFKLTPIGKPRMTQRDKWKRRPVVDAYYAFKDELNRQADKEYFVLEDTLTIDFYLPMPVSWSKKKRAQMEGKPHQQKPDIDNLLKSIFDCLTDDDSFIHSITARKFWSAEGRIVIHEDEEIDEAEMIETLFTENELAEIYG